MKITNDYDEFTVSYTSDEAKYAKEAAEKQINGRPHKIICGGYDADAKKWFTRYAVWEE